MTSTKQRNFIIGDNWIYYKIYSGPQTSDTILLNIVKPVTESLLQEGIISKWFFIRYADPHHHIRFRLYLPEVANLGRVVNELNPHLRKYTDVDLVWKIQIDTYQRELERYGTETIDLAEDVFFHQSVMVVGFLEFLQGKADENLRWLFAIRATDYLLDNFGYDLTQKLGLMEHLKTAFGNEFDMAKQPKIQLDSRYRLEKKLLEDFMNPLSEMNLELKPLFQAWLEKTPEKQKFTSLMTKVTMDSLVISFIHMLLNRIFKSKGRLNEMVCYDFLFRYYKSKQARQLM
jgi:thiopeptide-type bacteriocin biosynthesis protein